MTLFDLIAATVIGISALIGFSRGAVRELVGLLAFAVSAAMALFLLPWTGVVARHLVSGTLVATALALIGGFAVMYLAFKVVGHMLATQIRQQTLLGGADRSLGLGIGAVRALILLGLFALVFDHATPQDMKPQWITGSFLYPLASQSGRVLGTFAPSGLKVAGKFSPFLKNAVGGTEERQPSENDAVQSPPPPTNHLVISDASGHKDAATTPAVKSGRPAGRGYTKRTRDSLDAIVEKTR